MSVFKLYFLVIQKANASYFVVKLGRFSGWVSGTVGRWGVGTGPQPYSNHGEEGMHVTPTKHTRGSYCKREYEQAKRLLNTTLHFLITGMRRHLLVQALLL